MSFDLTQSGTKGNIIVSGSIAYKCITSGSNGNAEWVIFNKYTDTVITDSKLNTDTLAENLKELYDLTPQYGASTNYKGFQGNAGVLTLVQD